MAKRETSSGVPPQGFPMVTPDFRHAVDSTYTVESMMQVQRSLEELGADVRNLKSAVDSDGSKFDQVSHVVFAAGSIVAVLLAIFGFLISRG